jgi:hypothetical protein
MPMPMSLLHETRLSIGLIAVWTIILSCAIPAVRNEFGKTGPASSHAESQPGLQVTGLQYHEYDTSGLAASVKADSLAILPHRFLVFNLKSINEAHLENAQIEIHLHDKAPQDTEMVPLVTDMFAQGKKASADHNPRREFGLITRCVVEGITVKIYNADSPSIILRAERAYVDKRKRKTRFLYASLEDARSGRYISSREIIWDTRDKAFLIPGNYSAESASGIASSKGARVDLAFVVTPLLP